MNYYQYESTTRFEDMILFALESGKEVFCYLNTGWNIKKDKNHLISVLNVSLRQMYNRLYYGRHTKETIEKAIKKLSEN